jgi:hypothetical protein
MSYYGANSQHMSRMRYTEAGLQKLTVYVEIPGCWLRRSHYHGTQDTDTRSNLTSVRHSLATYREIL